MYRSVRDSGPVPIFPLTVLVGRRQSGKTSLLRALAGLDVGRARPFSLEDDWPRGSRQPRGSEHVVCSATLGLEDPTAETGAPGGGDPEKRLRVGRTYDGALVVEEWRRSEESVGVGEAGSFRRADERLNAYAREHLPRILFSEHNSLIPGAVSADVLASPGPAEEESGVAALSQLLRETGMGPDEVVHGLSPRKVRESGEQVRAVFEERGFSPGLVLDVDRGQLVLSIERGGVRTAADRLPKDEQLRLTVELRLAAAALDTDRRTVLLLDGPGRSFRRAAQGRMRRMLDAYACQGITVIYTARMPFQIELQHSEQVLVLAPRREGAMVDPCGHPSEPQLAVRAALGMTGRTSFTVNDLNLIVEGTTDARILEALDKLLEKSGREGLPGDLTLTSAQGAEEVAAVSTFLGRQGLGVIALFDSDSAGLTGNEHLREAAHRRPRMERLEWLQLGKAAGMDHGNAAIEDLFPQDYYMDAARIVCGRANEGLIARAARDVDGNPAARLSRIFQAQGRRFPKGKVVEALAERLEGMSSVDQLPEGMIEPVVRLMAAIRDAASRLREPSQPGSAEDQE